MEKEKKKSQVTTQGFHYLKLLFIAFASKFLFRNYAFVPLLPLCVIFQQTLELQLWKWIFKSQIFVIHDRKWEWLLECYIKTKKDEDGDDGDDGGTGGGT